MKACISIYDKDLKKYRYHSININNNTDSINNFFNYIDLFKKNKKLYFIIDNK